MTRTVHTRRHGRAVLPSLVGVVELVLLLRVGLGGDLDEAGGAALADGEVEDGAHGLHVEDVARVDEGRGGARGQLGPGEEGLLDGDEGAHQVDVEALGQGVEGEAGEGVLGVAEVGSGGCTAWLVPLTTHSSFMYKVYPRVHTIVDNDSGNTKLGLDLGEGIDNRGRVGKVGLDVELLVGAVLLADAPGDEGDLVALLCEEAADGLANVGTGSEDEGDGGSGHGVGDGDSGDDVEGR